jgi:hypothetical protein
LRKILRILVTAAKIHGYSISSVLVKYHIGSVGSTTS